MPKASAPPWFLCRQRFSAKGIGPCGKKKTRAGDEGICLLYKFDMGRVVMKVFVCCTTNSTTAHTASGASALFPVPREVVQHAQQHRSPHTGALTLEPPM